MSRLLSDLIILKSRLQTPHVSSNGHDDLMMLLQPLRPEANPGPGFRSSGVHALMPAMVAGVSSGTAPTTTKIRRSSLSSGSLSRQGEGLRFMAWVPKKRTYPKRPCGRRCIQLNSLRHQSLGEGSFPKSNSTYSQHGCCGSRKRRATESATVSDSFLTRSLR